jgi:hypothetical protein
MAKNPHYDDEGNLVLRLYSQPRDFVPPREINEIGTELACALVEDRKIRARLTAGKEQGSEFVVKILIPGVDLVGKGETFEAAIDDLAGEVQLCSEYALAGKPPTRAQLEILLLLQLAIQTDSLGGLVLEVLPDGEPTN